jgi:predicted phosphate transport protein (TIGR00153 family)
LVSIPGVTFSRKEGAILQSIEAELRIVRECEQQLPTLVAAVAKQDWPGCLAARDRIFEFESRTEALLRDLSTKIAEGAFFGGVREDILDLLGKIEAISDKAKDAARLITLAQITDEKALEVLRSEDMKQFLSSLDEAVQALQRLVEAFKIDKKTVLERVHTVRDHEEEADTFKQNMLTALFEKFRGGIDPVTLILVKDFLFCADDVADFAEHASDVVLVLVAKGYG